MRDRGGVPCSSKSRFLQDQCRTDIISYCLSLFSIESQKNLV